MHYRNLGRSNLKVSALCLGTMMFGDQTALPEAERIVADAHAYGVTQVLAVSPPRPLPAYGRSTSAARRFPSTPAKGQDLLGPARA